MLGRWTGIWSSNRRLERRRHALAAARRRPPAARPPGARRRPPRGLASRVRLGRVHPLPPTQSRPTDDGRRGVERDRGQLQRDAPGGAAGGGRRLLLLYHHRPVRSPQPARCCPPADPLRLPRPLGLRRCCCSVACKWRCRRDSGWYLGPNKAYDDFAGHSPPHTSRRDLISDLHAALAPRNIRLGVYLPYGPPLTPPPPR